MGVFVFRHRIVERYLFGIVCAGDKIGLLSAFYRTVVSKIKSPLRFSRYFEVAPDALATAGVFDPTLEADTPLFIDPILLARSAAPEFFGDGAGHLEEFFSDLYRLLAASRRVGDLAWEAAQQRLRFHEVPGTCLGYGGGSIHGSGWGPQLTGDLLVRAKEIIQNGVDDPRLFLLIGLFSPGIGPDRISDMTTNIIFSDIAAYTERICDSLGVPVEPFNLRNGEYFLPCNPSTARPTPILLLPIDVLRDLPVACCVEDIWQAAAQSEALRNGINARIGAMWQRANKEQKSDVLQALIRDPAYARTLIDRLTTSAAEPYNQRRDEKGFLIWSDIAYQISTSDPCAIAAAARPSVDELDRIVSEIIEQFQFLLEERDLWRVLSDSDSRKTEKTAQRLFFAVAYSYCTSNGLDVIPEADTGNGPVDFKFSVGAHPKILVELKLSRNNIQHGHDQQLPIYVTAERADRSHYVVIDVGSLGQKWTRLQASRTERGQTEPRVWLIDAQPRASASVRVQ